MRGIEGQHRRSSTHARHHGGVGQAHGCLCKQSSVPCQSTPMSPPPHTIHLPRCPRYTGAAGDNKSCRSRSPMNSAALCGQTCVCLTLHCHRVTLRLKGESLPGDRAGELPQSWDAQTSLQHEHRVAEVRGSRTSGLSPAPALRKCHRMSGGRFQGVTGSLGISALGRNIPVFPCSVSSPGGKVPGSRGEDGIAAACHFVSSASLPPHASKLWHLKWSWQVGHAGSG